MQASLSARTKKAYDYGMAKLINVDKIELRPDGWNRFVGAVHAAAKHGPMHRTAKPKSSRPKRAGRKSKKLA